MTTSVAQPTKYRFTIGHNVRNWTSYEVAGLTEAEASILAASEQADLSPEAVSLIERLLDSDRLTLTGSDRDKFPDLVGADAQAALISINPLV